LASVKIPSGVTTIGAGTCGNCTSMTNVIIPDSVSSIGEGAFYHCTSLTSVTIPGIVTSIGANAFSQCTRLTSVTIPSVFYSLLGVNAFSPCPSLTSVYFEGNAPYALHYSAPESTVFEQDIGATVYYFEGTTGWPSIIGNARTGIIPTMQLPGITITANPTNGVAPTTVSFTSASIDSNGHAVTNRSWNLGDGSTSTAQNPSHTYTAGGTFYVTLVETNQNGLPLAGAVSTISILPPPQPGIASITLAGPNLMLNGTNGLSGGTYYLLMSTNLALPLGQWTIVATNVLSASGNFTITATNTVNPNVPQRFYILETE
jgi:PKD repeat protein